MLQTGNFWGYANNIVVKICIVRKMEWSIKLLYALTFERLDLETLFLVCCYVFEISSSSSNIMVNEPR